MEALFGAIVAILVGVLVVVNMAIAIIGALCATILPFLLFIVLTVWSIKTIRRMLRDDQKTQE